MNAEELIDETVDAVMSLKTKDEVKNRLHTYRLRLWELWMMEQRDDEREQQEKRHFNQGGF